jgi:hypothetical protein
MAAFHQGIDDQGGGTDEVGAPGQEALRYVDDARSTANNKARKTAA